MQLVQGDWPAEAAYNLALLYLDGQTLPQDLKRAAELLRVAADAGHGIGTSLASGVEQDADTLSFLFEQLGMK